MFSGSDASGLVAPMLYKLQRSAVPAMVRARRVLMDRPVGTTGLAGIQGVAHLCDLADHDGAAA